MTVGKHRPRSSPRGDSSALCDICGSLWYRSRLTRKADGQLYCPDDIRGADLVTLSEAVARDSTRIIRGRQVRDSGSQDMSGASQVQMPDGILSDDLTGYWGPRDLLLGNGVRWMANIPNRVKAGPRGDMAQVTTSGRPAYDDDVTITYSAPNSEFMTTPSLPFVEESTAALSVWAVGSWDNPSTSTSDFLFHLTDVSGFMTYAQTLAHGVYMGIQNGVITAGVDNPSGGTITVTAQLLDALLHLFELRLTATQLLLFVDGAEVGATALTVPAAAPFELDYAYMGAGLTGSGTGTPAVVARFHTGKLNEVEVYQAAVTTDEVTNMEAYFGRTYSGLTLS